MVVLTLKNTVQKGQLYFDERIILSLVQKNNLVSFVKSLKSIYATNNVSL